MEAKDTVMSGAEMWNVTVGTSFWSEERKRREVAKAQAEITWPIAFKAGIREVVEWIKTQQLPKEYQAEEYIGLSVIPDKFWQAKLKEWGIE